MDAKILHGDCFKVMREMPNNNVDTVITDPPYGLSFMGKKWDYEIPSIEIWQECLRVAKPGAILLCFGGTRTYHRMACAIEDAGWQIRDCLMWIYGSGFPKSHRIAHDFERRLCEKIKGTWYYKGTKEKMRREPPFKDADANIWAEVGTGLKPAVEPIICAMKPLEGTFAENALKWGVAGLWIDGARVKLKNENPPSGSAKRVYKNNQYTEQKIYGNNKTTPAQGRFPANVILDEEAGKMLDEQSGKRQGTGMSNKKSGKGCWPYGSTEVSGYKDKGGASRFFYCAKASKAERNAGCEGLEVKQTKGGGGMNNTEDDVCGKYGSIKSAGHNHHPTVKPLKLMEYLCKLTRTPTGGVVLDPFCGSGTTCIAAIHTNRGYIGIEREPEYVEIARARLAAYLQQTTLDI